MIFSKNTHKISQGPYFVSIILWSLAIYFSFLSATFIHKNFSIWYFLSALLPLILSISVLVFKPNIKVIFFTMLSFLISCGILMPVMPNHRYVLMLATILLSLPLIFAKNGDYDNYFETTTIPSLRILTVIVYFFACITKLNFTYIDPERSCATLFYHHIYALHSFLPENHIVQLIVIYGSIVVEILLPILFLMKFNTLPIVLGLVFHFILALDVYKYFTNFSSVMAFLLITSGGRVCLLEVSQVFHEFINSVFKKRIIFNIIFLAVTGLVLYFSFTYGLLDGEIQGKRLRDFVVTRHVLWIIYGMFLLIICLRIVCRKKDLGEFNFNFPLKRIEVLILVFAILNGLTPFLGIKTRTGFNMYSNLRIEADISNHMIFGKSLNIGDYLTDTAIIKDNKNEMICGGVLFNNAEYPIFEILRASNNCKDEVFFYYYQNKQMLSNSLETERLREEKTIWLSRKILTFKPIGLKAETECTW